MPSAGCGDPPCSPRRDAGAALTVHAYSPPLRVQGTYRVAADVALERDVSPYTEELVGGSRRTQAGILRTL